MDTKGNDLVIHSGGSSWAKKMIVLRTDLCGMSLFYNLFIFVVDILARGMVYEKLGFVGRF